MNDLSWKQLHENEDASLFEASLRHLRDLLTEVATDSGAPYLLLDLFKVDVFAARFVRLLMRVWERLRSGKRRLAICGLRASCAGLVCAFRLDKLVEVYLDHEAAIESIRKRLDGNGRLTERVKI